MYRFIFRTVQITRTSSVNLYESNVFSAKCEKAALPVFGATNGSVARAVSTSSARLCEKKDGVVSSTKDEKTTSATAEDPPQPPTLSNKETGSPEPVSEQREEPVVLASGDAAKPTDATVELVVEKKVKTAAKSGKEGLLNLLGAMKVEVTNKKKLKNLKEKQSLSSPKPNPPAMESTISMYQKATMEAASSQSETLDPSLVAAASAAASTLPNSTQAESELLQQLRRQQSVSEDQRKGDMGNLGVIIADMKVGKDPSRQNSRTANQIHFDDDGQGFTPERGITSELSGLRRKRYLFSGRRLNIFSRASGEEGKDSAAAARPTLWDMDFAHQLSQSASEMPCNRFEEMIQWTKKGLLWQYPINNEAGLEEEASVPFHEHIFLEKHLEEGFPHQGPVRHFMELVVAGLSRNPHLTVQQKKEHIAWFKDYFHQKQDVLNDAEVYLS